MKTKNFISTSTSEPTDPKNKKELEHETGTEDKFQQNLAEYLLEKVKDNEKRIKELEDENKGFNQLTMYFLKIQKLIYFFLFLFPIIMVITGLLVLIMIGVSLPAKVLWAIITAIGIIAIIEIVLIPKKVIDIEKKVEKIEDKLESN